MKKKSVKIGIAFIIIIVICIFISGTISSLVTAKANFIKPFRDKIRNDYELSGQIVLSDEQDIYYQDAVYYPIKITNVIFKPGDAIKKGDVLFEYEVCDTARDLLNNYYEKLNQFTQSRLLLQETMISNNYDFESEEAQLTISYIETEKQLSLLKIKIEAENNDIDLSEDDIDTIEEESLSEESLADLTEYRELIAEFAIIQENLVQELEIGRNTTFKLTQRWIDINEEIAKTESDIKNLISIINKTKYEATDSGRIIDVNISIGQIYTGHTILYKQTSSPEVFVEVKIAGLSPEIIDPSNEFKVVYEKSVYKCYDATEKLQLGYMYFFMESAFYKSTTNIISIIGKEVDIFSISSSPILETVYPIRVLSKEDDKYYIFTATKQKGIWGEEYRIRKIEVNLGKSNERYVSLNFCPEEEEYVLVDWSRPLIKGRRVMEYVN